MKKLSDFKGEEALDVLADIIDPVAEIMSDRGVRTAGPVKLDIAKYIIKNHKQSLIEILARLNEQTVDEYKATSNLFSLPLQILSVLNDEELGDFFVSQGLGDLTEETSGSATEDTQEDEG